MHITPLATSRDLLLNVNYLLLFNFCVVVQAVRQIPSPSDVKGSMDTAKDQVMQKGKEMVDKGKEMADKVKPPSGRR